MKTINFTYHDKTDLISKSGELDQYPKENVLIQVFSGISKKETILKLMDEIKDIFPGISVLGATTAGEIIGSESFVNSIVISISIFEKGKVKSGFSENNHNMRSEGRKIGKKIDNDNVKAVIAFACGIKNGMFTNGEEFLYGLRSELKDVIIAGGHAGDNEKGEITYVFTEKGISENGVAAVSVSGESLRVNNSINMSWVPIGKKFTITSVSGSRVYKIEDKTPYDLYRQYLGEDIAENLPLSAADFPLMVEREGLYMAILPMFINKEDGSCDFLYKLYPGEQVRFSFCHAGLLRLGSGIMKNELAGYNPQSIFVYSCASRKWVMGNDVSVEISILKDFPSSAGFFSYGEYYSNGLKKSDFFTQTMTAISFSEITNNEDNDLSGIKENIIELDKDVSRKFKTLLFLHRLVEATTNELEVTNKKLASMAKVDPLTGLFNRRLFDERLNFEIKRESRVSGSITLMMIDIDHFKLFNDTFGHVSGDDCLRGVAKTIKDIMKRPTDLPCRYGGEEFACIVPITDHEGAMTLAEVMRFSVEKLGIPNPKSPVSDCITLSIGVLTASCRRYTNPEDVINRCDELLYRAKESGRNRVVGMDESL